MTFIVGVLILIQLVYWYLIFGAILCVKKSIRQKKDIPLTTIICAKNELVNLRANLPYIMQQKGVENQIIVANDFSADGTSQFIKKIDNSKGNVKLYEVKQNKQGKKQALAEALTQTDTDLVLLTDADCRPSSSYWAQSMADCIDADIKLVLGYAPLKSASTLLSKWCHFEAWVIAVQYLSYAAKGIPYMGVGRNMLYDKHSLPPKAIEKYNHLASGDDDLTVMQIATKKNTAINLDSESFVYSDAPPSFVAYWHQKTRHYSTATSYKRLHKVLLGLYSLTQILMYVGLAAMLIMGDWRWALILAFLRWILIIPQAIRIKKLLLAKFNVWLFPIYDVVQSLNYVLFSFAVLIPQKNKW